MKGSLEANIENYRFREALKDAMNIARIGNKYLADREDKTDAAALYFENAKYTFRIISMKKYPMAPQRCTLSGTAGG